MSQPIPDSELQMWDYARHRYSTPTGALEAYIPSYKNDPVLVQAVATVEMANLAILSRMTQLTENLPDEND